MTKPPFQFGLKAILLATTAAALLACLAVPGAQQIKIFTAIAVLAALASVAILAAAVLVALGFSFSMLLYHAIRFLFRKPIKVREYRNRRSRRRGNVQ